MDGDPRLGQGSAGGAREGVRDRRLVGLDAAPGAVAHEEVVFAAPPAFEPPQGSLAGCYSRRINRRHRLVYKMLREPHERNDNHCEGTVRILRMWTRYDGLEKESEIARSVRTSVRWQRRQMLALLQYMLQCKHERCRDHKSP